MIFFLIFGAGYGKICAENEKRDNAPYSKTNTKNRKIKIMKYNEIITYNHEVELLRAAAQMSAALRFDFAKGVKIKTAELNSFYNFDFSEYEKIEKFQNLKTATAADCVRELLYFRGAYFSKSFKKSDVLERLQYLDGWAFGRFEIAAGFSILHL